MDGKIADRWDCGPESGLSGSQATRMVSKRVSFAVVDEQPPGKALAGADDLLQHFRRLQRADDADDGAEHADLGAVRHRPRRRRVGKMQR